jgi:hypothetical protein
MQKEELLTGHVKGVENLPCDKRESKQRHRRVPEFEMIYSLEEAQISSTKLKS